MNTKFHPTKKKYYHMNELSDLNFFSKELANLIIKKKTGNSPIVILCIGTDRATGDSLGPIVGYKLRNFYMNNVVVYGTLENPIHAKNLNETLSHINQVFTNPFIIAIDACLGKISHIGLITLGEGALSPGSGVNKSLPDVGNIYITGIVNFSGFMDTMILQSTRLNVVMTMADFISTGIKRAFARINYQKQDTAI